MKNCVQKCLSLVIGDERKTLSEPISTVVWWYTLDGIHLLSCRSEAASIEKMLVISIESIYQHPGQAYGQYKCDIDRGVTTSLKDGCVIQIKALSSLKFKMNIT